MRATKKLIVSSIILLILLQFSYKVNAQGCLGADGASGIGGGVARIQNGSTCANIDNALPNTSIKGAILRVTATNVSTGDLVEANINWNDGTPATGWFTLTDLTGGVHEVNSAKHFFPATNTSCEYQPTTQLRVNGVVCNNNFGVSPVFFRWNLEGAAYSASSLLSVTNTDAPAQTVIQVCAGATTTVSFTDRSNLNCNTFNATPGAADVTVSGNLNNRRRWRQFVYGGAGALHNITGGVTVNGTPVPAGTAFDGEVISYALSPAGQTLGPAGGDDLPTFGTGFVTPPTTARTLDITVPATAVVGQEFVITTRYWNACNRYDQVGEVPVEYNDSRIRIVAQAPPPTGNPVNRTVCQGTVPAAFTISAPAGATNPTYKWYKNNAGVPSATVLQSSNSLTLPINSYDPAANDSLQMGLPGYYKVWVSYTPGIVGAVNCESIKIPLTIIIRPTITTPAAITGPNEVCSDNVTEYDFSEGSDSPTMLPNPAWVPNQVGGNTFYTWSWSDNTDITAIAATGTTNKNLLDVKFNISAATFGAAASISRTLNVNSRYANGAQTCVTTPNTTLPVTIYRQTAAGTIAPTTRAICTGITTGTLTLSGHRGSIIRWERIYTPPAGIAGAPETIVHTAATFSETPPYGAGAYEYRAVVRNGACTTLTSASSIVTVNPVPVKPTITQGAGSNGLTICLGQQTVLQSNNPGNLAAVYRWYKMPDLVTPVQATASNTLTLNAVAQSGDYVVQVVGVAPSNCASPVSDPVTVTIRALPAVTSVTGGGAACDGNPAPDIIFNFSGGAPYNFTIDVPVGADIVVTGHATNSYTLSGQTDPGNYQITALSNGCTATVLGTAATVTSSGGSPVFDGARVLTPTSTCDAGASTTDPSLTFSLAGGAATGFILTYRIDGGSNRTKNFNTDAAGTPTAALVFTDTELNTLTPSPHVLRLVSIQSPTGCLGLFNEDIQFTVNPLPAAPTSGGNVIACSDVIGAATVSATVGAGQTVDWYTAATGGTLLLGGNTTLNPATANEPTPGNTVTYYAEARNTTTGCISTGRTAVTLRSDHRPSAPNAGGDFDVCAQSAGPHTATLAATAADNGGTGTWTAAPGITFGSVNSPTSTVSGLALGPNTLTWTVRSNRSGNAGACADQQAQVIVTVNSLPAAANPAPVLCENVNGTLTAFSTNLNAFNDGVTGITGSTDRTIQWFTNNARLPIHLIADPTDVDITNSLTLYTRVRNSVTTCTRDGIISFTVVSQPVASPQTYEFCEEFPGGSNQALNIDLTANTIIDPITGITGSTGRTVTWFHTLADANGNVNPITDANSYDILSGNESVYARVAVTSGAACVNVAKIDLVIKPRPADPVIVGSDNQCVGSFGLYNVTPVAGATYTWDIDDNPATEFEVLAVNDFLTVVSFPNVYTGDIRVTVEVNGCASNQVSKEVAVNATPPPVIITPSVNPVCSNQTGVTYTATLLPLTDYTWEIPAVGGATGSSIIGGQGSNVVTVNVGSVSGNIRVVPQTQGGSCAGSPATFFIDVRQRPTMATYATPAATVCSDTPINIDFTVGGSVAAPTFRITNVTVPPGLSPSTRAFNPLTPVTATEIHNDVFTNTTNVNLDVRYTVIPVSADGCEGPARDIFARIRPEPVLAANIVATVCSGDPNGLVFTVAGGSIFADQFEITSIVNTGGLTSTAGSPTTGTFGPNEIGDDVWINTTGVQHEIQYFVRPVNTTSGCVGDPAVPVRVIVNPEPQITSAVTDVICSGNAPLITLTSSIPGSTFQWTLKSTTGLISGGGSGTGSTITNILVNGSTTPGTATYEIIATGTAALGSCQSEPVDLVVTINAAPLTTNVDQTVCSDDAGGNTYVENLTALQGTINGSGGLTFSWHTTEANAIANVSPITTPGAYPLQDQIPVFVRVDNGTCAKIQAVKYTINSTPSTTASITSDYNGAQLSCATSSNGVITATVPPATHGTAPFQYSIDGGTSYFTSPVFNGLSATGNPYVVTVRDSKGCTNTSAPLNFIPPVPVTATTAVTSDYNGAQISCNGLSDGSIQVSPVGGTGAYTYSILELPSNNSGATTGLFTGLGAGNYTFVVRDVNGCSFTTPTVSLTAPVAISAVASLTSPVTCSGDSDGQITVTASGGTVTTTYTYTLNQAPFTSNTTGIFSGLPAGTYSVNVTDNNTCLRTSNFISVTQPTGLSAFASVTSNYSGAKISCPGANDAVITVTANGGNGGYSYVLVESPANTTGNATGVYTGVGPGTYTVRVTDSKLCTMVTVAVNITEPTAIDASAVVASTISCNGGSDGEIRVAATGGTGAYTFTMITPAGPSNSTGIFSGLGQGTYDFEVRDLNNCTDVVQIILNQPVIVAASAVVNAPYNGAQISCNGSNDGVITVTATGGTGAFTYVFDQFPANLTGASTGVFTGVAPGTGYTFTVRDVKTCSVITLPVSVVQPTPVIASAAVTSNHNGEDISCPTATDGQITVTASGGTGALTYRLDQVPGNTSGNASGVYTGVGAGSYTVTVRDANNCFVVTASVTVTPPASVTASAAVTSNYNGRQVSCNGASDGAITVTAGGGVAPYSYILNEIPGNTSGATTGLFTGIPAGTYTFNVRDANNCPVATLPVTISQPTALAASGIVISNYNGQQISCVGASDGSIRLTAFGGTTPYSYVSVEVPGNVSGATTGVFTGLAAGSYTFTISDANSCSLITTAVVIAPPTALTASAAVTSDYHGSQISCAGVNDGRITVTASGGTGVLHYEFIEDAGNTSGSSSGVFFGVAAGGPYTFRVTDANGCSVVTTGVTITPPIAIGATAAVTSNYNGEDITCPTANDGQITVTATGGTGAYTYRLDQAPLNTSGNSSGIYVGVPAGTYTVTVRDENSCFIITAPVTITPPTPVTASGTVTSDYNGRDISCNGASDGEITITPGGGVGPYTYVLNQIPGNTTGATTGVFTGLPAGTYTVTVRDVNLCPVTTSSIIVAQPAVLGATAAVTSNYNGQQISCIGEDDGQITVTVSGGTGPYAYTSVEEPTNTSGATTGIFTGLVAGNYTFNVTDANSCATTTLQITISEPAQMAASLAVTSTYNGREVSCNGASDGELTVSVTVPGTGTMTYTIDQLPANASGRFSGVFTGVPAGSYTVTVRDVNNCFVVTNMETIDVTPPIVANTAVTKNVSCFGESNGIITVTASGGTGDFTYLLIEDAGNMTGTASGVFTGLRAGNYRVRVTDINTCFVTTVSVPVTQPANLTITIAKVSPYNGFDLSCSGASDGEVRVTATNGGTGPYTYTLDGFPGNTTGATTGIFTGLSAGMYTITVTDANSADPFGPCTRQSLPVFLTDPVPLFQGIVGFDKQICIGDDPSTFTQLAAPIGGIGNYTYQWQDSIVGGAFANIGGATSATFDPPAVTQTTYYRRITTSGTCASLVTNVVSVTVNPLPAIASVDFDPYICENQAMIVTYDFAPGQAPFYFSYTQETIDQSGAVIATKVVVNEISGDSKPVIQSPFVDDIRITVNNIRDFNGCVANPALFPAPVYVEVLKTKADFVVTSPDPQCSGSPFTVEWQADPEVEYTFKWPEGPDEVRGEGLTGTNTATRNLFSQNPTGTQSLPIILTAQNMLHLTDPANIPECGVATALKNIHIYPAIIANVVLPVDEICSGTPVTITNSTQGGTTHAWTVTRVSDGVVMPAPLTRTGPKHNTETFVINNQTTNNPEQYEIHYEIQNSLGNGSCQKDTTVTVTVYREAIAKIGAPKNPLTPIPLWSTAPQNIAFENATVPIDGGDFEYTWIFSNNNINTPPDTTVSAATTVSYPFQNPGEGKRATLIVVNRDALTAGLPDGCATRDNFVFKIEIPPLVADFVQPDDHCVPGAFTLQNLSTGGDIVYHWTITNLDAGDEYEFVERNPEVNLNRAGRWRIQLEIWDPNFPGDKKIAPEKIVNVHSNPIALFTTVPFPNVFVGEPMRAVNTSVTGLDFSASTGGVPSPIEYEWNFRDGTILTTGPNPDPTDPLSNHSPLHTYRLEEGQGYDIKLTAKNVYNGGSLVCKDTTFVKVFPRTSGTSKIPNAFTPNPGGPNGGIPNDGDGSQNDVFLPITKGVKEFQMQIFDRWGNLLFESTQQTRGWDGYDKNGNLLPAGVYVYKLVLRMANDQRTTQVGDVTLIR